MKKNVILLLLISILGCNDGTIPDISSSLNPNEISWPSGLIAFWDFSETQAPFENKVGQHKYRLWQGVGSNVLKSNRDIDIGPFGSSIMLDGIKDFLIIPSDSLGDLDIGKRGNTVTICAWIKVMNDPDIAYIAGMWREDNKDPRRQYGLFYHLPAYGGQNRICGHISRTGNSSKGIPYSRDYSSSARAYQVNTNYSWRFVTMTYDGHLIKSYLDGMTDSYTNYTEPKSPLGQGLTYDKNPYIFNDGLNSNLPANFTVGAGEGIPNYFKGCIGGLAIFNRALNPSEIMQVHLATAKNNPIFQEPFYIAGGGSNARECILYGWKSVRGTNAENTSTNSSNGNFHLIDAGATSQFYLFRTSSGDANVSTNNTTNALSYFDTFSGVKFSQLKAISFTLNNSLASDKIRFAVRIGSNWYVTNESYGMMVDGATAANWTMAENKRIILTQKASSWRDLSFIPQKILSLSDSVKVSNLIDGEVTGIGFFSHTTKGVLRIDNLNIY